MSYMFAYDRNSNTFLNYDVEVIYKDVNRKFFETIFVRDENIKLLKQIGEKYNSFKFYEKNTGINIEKEIVFSILNLKKMDKVILDLLKIRGDESSNIYNLIFANNDICREIKRREV